MTARAPAMHYSGGVEYTDGRDHLVVQGPGYPACCSGDKARAIRARGEQTDDRAQVRCKECLRRLALQDARDARLEGVPVPEGARSAVTEEEIQRVLAGFPEQERGLIEAQRRDLAEMGITRQPLQIEMACLFAGVLLSQRRGKAALQDPAQEPKDPA